MNNLRSYLQGGDLRSIAKVNEIVLFVENRADFDELFQYLYSDDRLIVMRAADAIEKITMQKPEYLITHRNAITALLKQAANKELKWHLALLTTRVNWSTDEVRIVWNRLLKWAADKKESKIVRVNAVQALFEISQKKIELKKDFDKIIRKIEVENIPSLKARLRKLKKE